MDSTTPWTRGDVLTAVSIGVAIIIGIIGAWASLFSSSFQRWRKSRREREAPITLGDLSDAKPYVAPLPPGIAKADRATLGHLLEQLPSSQMHWLHEKDFGNGFPERAIEKIQHFSWNHTALEHEFLDSELESMRLDLKSAAQEFVHYVGLHTDLIFPGTDNDVRKIPDQYEKGQYSDRPFFATAKEINDAAEKACEIYQALIRRARVKLAMSDTGEAES